MWAIVILLIVGVGLLSQLVTPGMGYVARPLPYNAPPLPYDTPNQKGYTLHYSNMIDKKDITYQFPYDACQLEIFEPKCVKYIQTSDSNAANCVEKRPKTNYKTCGYGRENRDLFPPNLI